MKALKIFFAVAAAISMATSLGYLNSIANNPIPEVNYLIPGLLVISFIYLHLVISDYLVPIRSMNETEVGMLKSATHKTYNNSFLRGVQGLGYILLISGIFPLFEPAIFEQVDGFNPAGSILFAFLLVIAGVATKARGAFLFLLTEYRSRTDT